MQTIDASVMSRLRTQAQDFQRTQPYPWIRIADFLYPEKFDQLCKDLPDPVLFGVANGLSKGAQATKS
ncbi:hypothetical protein [Acidithiobacillus sp.]|uniref:hypothetical protein n=1 Tax=Acidithiobacillus sp. TaxID=1872118 RepID=UPI002620570C|nr:hypothetical protein [Acidithiobacillus sp.]